MSNVGLWLTEAGAALVESVIIDALVDAAKQFDGLDRKKEPETYRLARLQLVTAATVLAEVVSPSMLARHAQNNSGPAFYDDSTGFDPRASSPRCTHGILFSDPCETCAANTPPDVLPPEVGPEVVAGIQL